jgi:hypothetical protein
MAEYPHKIDFAFYFVRFAMRFNENLPKSAESRKVITHVVAAKETKPGPAALLKCFMRLTVTDDRTEGWRGGWSFYEDCNEPVERGYIRCSTTKTLLYSRLCPTYVTYDVVQNS